MKLELKTITFGPMYILTGLRFEAKVYFVVIQDIWLILRLLILHSLLEQLIRRCKLPNGLEIRNPISENIVKIRIYLESNNGQPAIYRYIVKHFLLLNTCTMHMDIDQSGS